MVISSSAGITRTLTGLLSREITRAWEALRPGSMLTPRNSSPAQIRARIEADLSPIPPVKMAARAPAEAVAQAGLWAPAAAAVEFPVQAETRARARFRAAVATGVAAKGAWEELPQGVGR